jgi:hypothetical protein
MFDVHFLVNPSYENNQGQSSFSIKLAAPQASGGAYMKVTFNRRSRITQPRRLLWSL